MIEKEICPGIFVVYFEKPTIVPCGSLFHPFFYERGYREVENFNSVKEEIEKFVLTEEKFLPLVRMVIVLPQNNLISHDFEKCLPVFIRSGPTPFIAFIDFIDGPGGQGCGWNSESHAFIVKKI